MTTEGTPRRKGRTLRRWLALPLAAGFLLALAAPAHATFPGQNGKIVYQDLSSGDTDIFVRDADGSNVTALTSDSSSTTNRNPEWSADGTKIVFQSNRDGSDQIHVMNDDGTGRMNLLVAGVAPAWSPDGTRITYWTSGGLWTVNATGTPSPVLLKANTTVPSERRFDPDWSPDGTKIAYHRSIGTAGSMGRGIYVIDVSTGTETLLAGGLGDTNTYIDAEWSADGTKVYYVRREGQDPPEIWSVDPSGSGTPTQVSVTATINGGRKTPAPAPDGTKIAYSDSGSTYTMNPDGTGAAVLPPSSPGLRQDWQPIPNQPDLQPIQISKTTTGSGVTGKWTWKMGKWTTSKLEQNVKGPKPYTFKVLVDSHGFKVQKAAVRSRITLTNPNDVPINGSVNDALPGAQCVFFEGDPLPIPVTIPANGSIDVNTACLIDGDPSGPVTNTATFTLDEAHELGPQPVSAQATTTIDETPPPNSPGQKVALRDPMWHGGTKVLRHLDAVGGPASITASYTVKLIPPATPGKCWWHHNTAHLQDVATGKKILKSNRVSVYLCRPKDAPKGKDPKKLPKVGKDGIPIVTPKLGGPKVIPAKYRTRLRTSVRAPRAVFRGQAFRAVIRTRNMTRKRAFGTIVKVKVPKGMRVATKQRGIRTKGRFAYWTVKALGPRKSLRRSLKLVAIRPGARRIIAISNARNAKRSGAKATVRVLRPRPTVS